MSLQHHLLAGAYYPLKLANVIARRLGLASPHRLRVLVYHDIAPHDQVRFGAQLRWLARRWIFVTPESFSAMVSGEEAIRGSNLLLTFDDGFASNRVVAEEVLNPMGIRALFFTVSDFVGLANRDEAKHFIARHIQPGSHADELPAHLYNMGWADLEALLEQGHCVGGHTRTHARLSQIVQADELEGEIVGSTDMLEQRLGVKVEHFAYTFGNLASFSPTALAVARRRFRYIYTGLRGDNAHNVAPWAIRRDAIAPANPLSLVGALLEAGTDRRYAGDLAEYESWGCTA